MTPTLANQHSYRCYVRPINHPCAPDQSLDKSIQVKARNAIEATRLAMQVTDMAVLDVERIDAPAEAQ